MWTTNHPAHVDSGILSIIPVSDIPGLEFEDQVCRLWFLYWGILNQENRRMDSCGGARASEWTKGIRELCSHNDWWSTRNCDEEQTKGWNAQSGALSLLDSLKIERNLFLQRRIPQNTGPRYSTVFKMRSRPAVTGSQNITPYRIDPSGPRYQQDYVVYEMQEKALKESAGDEK